jgi:hypothetical protein
MGWMDATSPPCPHLKSQRTRFRRGHPTPGTLRSAKKVRVEAARACGRVANPLKLFHDQALAPEGGRVANPLKLSHDQTLAPEGAQPFPFFGKGGPGEAPSHFCAQTKFSTLRLPFSPALAVESGDDSPSPPRPGAGDSRRGHRAALAVCVG